MNILQTSSKNSKHAYFLSYITFLISAIFYLLVQPSHSVTTNPQFITTLSNFQIGTWVLTTTSPTTSGTVSYQNTNVNFINAYSSVPNIGIGIDFINSNYNTTLSTVSLIIDVSIVQKLQSYALIQLNRTTNTIQQISLNYIVCDSSFWLDIRQTFVDLSTLIVFTSGSATSKSVVVDFPYKTKSNSTNSMLVYNTIGLEMFRQSHIYTLDITLVAKGTTTFSLNILVGGSNRLKWIRVCSYSYQSIANTVDPPFYIDLGILTSFSGTIPDSSGLTVSQYGTVYTAMVDWTIDDTNSVLNYNMGGTGLSYTLTTTSLTASKTAYFWYRKQSCPQYNFLNSHLCQSCHYSCLSCYSTLQTDCITCPTTRTYLSTNRTCPCIANYVNVNVSLCVQLTCQATCLTCANLNQCATCDASIGRYLSGINCLCNDYFIDVYADTGVKVCFPCHFTCKSCSSSFVETACLSCNTTKDRRFYRASNNTCACMDKFFQGAGSNPVCSSCHYSCATCLAAISCTACNITRGRYSNSSVSQFCLCLSSTYDDLISEQCIACSVKCLTCNSLGCLTCNATLNRIISNRSCICNSGYFDDNVNSACQPCNFTCATCNDLTQCSSCNSLLQRYMDVSTGVNLCLCAQRYYSISGVQQCMFCYLTCVTCNGANQNNCLSCDATKYRQLSVDNKCVCSAGYYEVFASQQLCERCHYTCQTCDNPMTCLTCNATKFRVRNGTNDCMCMNGYFNNGNELCSKCDYRCLTCTSSLVCLTCDAATRNTTNLTNCVCLSGFWDDGISNTCKPCLAGCSTCINGNNCSSCPLTKVITATLTCVCKTKTYQPNCLPCNYNCQQCVNTAVQCSKCNGTAMRILNTTSKTCVCFNGYFDDGLNQQCATCHYSCQTCLNYGSCQTCPLNRAINGTLCTCVSQFYQNSLNKKCLSCHYTCKLCSTYSQCTQCDATKFRRFPLTGLTNLTLCQCMDGYYDDGVTQICYPCDAKCQTCTNYDNCLTCNSTLNRYFVPAAGAIILNNCLCLDKFFQSTTTYLCVACHYSCNTCLNQLSCTSCVSGRYQLVPSVGYCLCNNGTFQNPATQTCSICSYPCIECTNNSTACTSCDLTTRYYVPAWFQCQCKVGTFENGTACDTCMATCSECTTKVTCTVCKLGANRNLDGNNLCPCIYGHHDENSTLITCLRCHYSCLTCRNSLTCDTCFSGRIPVTNSTCACPAQRFYDDLTNGACVACSYKCLTCSNISSNCTSCSASSNRDLILNTSNDCICKQGYYDATVEVCVKCHYSCKSCSSSSPCTSCDNTINRTYILGPLCQCNNGFFDDGINSICQACAYSCSTCVSADINCLTCPATRTHDNVNKVCPCNVGYFDSGVPNCSQCLYSCKQCINAYECTSCPVTRYLETSSKQCLCNSGFYNINGTYECLSCHPLCLTCTDYDVCLTCNTSTNFRYLVTGKCKCDVGYFDAWESSVYTNSICQKCHYSCQSCGSLIQCSSCSALSFRNYNITSLLCSCRPGYYDDGTNTQCILCPFDCLTCSSATICLTCAPQRVLNASLRCDCGASYYTNGTTCELCQPQCSTCTNLTYCTACNGDRILSASNTCICPIAKFMVANTALCSACQYSCQTCVSLLKCSTCNITNQRFLSGSFCRCSVGYFDDNTTQPCVQCHYSCKSCIQANKCLLCDFTLFRVFNLVSQLCQCQTGYYQDPVTKLCIKCHYTCVTCLNGNTCLTCNNLYNRQFNSTNFQCQCPLTLFYDDGTQDMCQSCNLKCLSCITLSTTCTSCLNTTYRELNVTNCNCINGYYDSGAQICSKCSYKCLTCTNLPDQCTSCQLAKMRVNNATCSCEIGFFDDGVNSLCQPCDYRCLTCLNGFTCQTCNSSHNRVFNNVARMCDCMPVFYDTGSNPECVTCTYSCVTCLHPTLCITCPPTRIYKNGICECRTKYYDDFASLQCPACDYTCATCTNTSQCSSCSAINYRSYNITTRKCSCIQRYFDDITVVSGQQLCVRCHASCLTCTNLTHCSSCPPNLNKNINLTVSTYCDCLYGFYENITAGLAIGQSSRCFTCHYSCQKCINASYICTECQPAKNRFFESGAYQCLCLPEHYDDGINELCIKCATNCLTCWGVGANQCLTCLNTSYFLNNSCYAQCPSYYMPSINLLTNAKICQLCTAFCIQCGPTATICKTCQASHRLFTFNSSFTLCIDHCPQFYYQTANKQCLQCISPCYHCTGKYQCTDCISGHYVDTYCYKCHPYCYSCSGPTVFQCITCINGYYLDNGLCRKLTCGLYQYVHSLFGCMNCSNTYPNSLTCDSFVINSCRQNYILQSTNNSNGTVSTICRSCGNVTGYKMITLANSQFECVQICGDGIAIKDLCDDGNTLNGDGCSQNCKIQKDWLCTNTSSCRLKITPTIQVTDVIKVQKRNDVEVYLQLNIGLRLIKENFIVSFIPHSTTFSYFVSELNSKYTQYKITISYKTTVQSTKLNIQVISPIPNPTAVSTNIQPLKTQQNDDNSRLLQTISIVAPLTITLNLDVNVQINTQPPAVFIDPQTRTAFSSYLIYLFMGFQIISILLIVYMVYKRIKLMLLSIDLLTSLRIVYILTTFGMFKIGELMPGAVKGLQPFIYPFGPEVINVRSGFYQFDYTKLIFSSCIIQLVILTACGLVKFLSSNKNTQNQAHYYLNAFMYCFSVDIYLSCLATFVQTLFSTFVGSYSWAIAIILFIMFIMHNFTYISEGKLYLNRNMSILPTKSFVTSQLDAKEKDLNQNNNVLDVSLFTNSNLDKSRNNQNQHQGQMWQQNYTQSRQSNKSFEGRKDQSYSHTQKSKKSSEKSSSQKHSNQQNLQTLQKELSPIQKNKKFNKQSPLPFFLSFMMIQSHRNTYDLLPSSDYSSKYRQTSSVFYQTTSRNKISLYHLPILNNVFPFLLVLIVSLLNDKFRRDYLILRSVLLLIVVLVAFLFFIWDKSETIKGSVRNIKLLANFVIYLVICALLLIASSIDRTNNPLWIDYFLMAIVTLQCIGNIIFWILNLKYSPQYKQYLIQLKNQQILQRNRIQQQPRKKIYTNNQKQVHGNTNSAIKNIFRKYPNKNQTQLKSHSVSEIHSMSQQNSFYNKKTKNTNIVNNNVFDQQEEQVQNEVQQQQQQINRHKASIAHTKVFSNVPQRKNSRQIIVSSYDSKDKMSEIQKLKHLSSDLYDLSSVDNQLSEQSNNNAPKKVILPNSSYIQKNKRISPQKVSTLNKKESNQRPQSKMTNANFNTLQKELQMQIQIEQQQQGKQQQYYNHRNPPKSRSSKPKPQSKGKSPSPNKHKLNKSLLSNNNINSPLQYNNNNNTRISDETNAPYGVVSRNQQTKIDLYEIKDVERGNQRKYKNLKSDGLSDGLSYDVENQLSDDLSEKDYEPQFPTGISKKKAQRKGHNKNPSQASSVISKAKKLKKSPTKQRKQSTSVERKPSLSPSKLSYYPKKQLQDISSIIQQQQPMDLYSQGSQIDSALQLGDNVYNKILKDYDKYKNKKVDKVLIKQQLKK